MPIVSLEEAKRHLRIEGNVDDALISENIGVAEGYVESFVGTIGEVADDVPDTLKKAILFMTEYYFDGNNSAKERADELILPHREWYFG
ncbi:MAG: hypothetical protein K0S56_1607 [Microvirga sp.]|jgi:uncharacterized phage protein (predicted DNA packaging)|nr:hypothetical protein [Microvirga sp.]